MSAFFLSTPIYYVNASPHLGHAYSTLVADSAARFHRLMGQDTFLLTGTDEHGDKIVQAAQKAGCSPEEYVDSISTQFQQLWPALHVDYDDFIRTTQKRHITTVQTLLQRVWDKGDIYQSEYEGLYCYGCEQFLTEKDLQDGLCPDHGTAPESIREKNYFFRMSTYQEWLQQYILDTPDFIRPEKYRTEVLSMLEMGVLEDLCISRPKSRLTWGIELPFDTDYVTYVWFDALINYLTALDWPHGRQFQHFWPAAHHLVAKDILKPHAIFWPTMLRAAGIEPYKHLTVHGYWLIKETKMSKSRGNVVDPLGMAQTYGPDVFRYFLLREMRFGNDAAFSEQALIERLNADLANDLGNLFSRVLSMMQKYFSGTVPLVPKQLPEQSSDRALLDTAHTAFENFQQLYTVFEFDRALESLWELVRALNKYVDTSAPWTLFKEKQHDRLAQVMVTLLCCMRGVAFHLWPVMPGTAQTMLAQLGQDPNPCKTTLQQVTATLSTAILPQTVLAQASNLFPRVEKSEKTDTASPQDTKAKKSTGKPAKPDTPETALIEYTDFTQLDLRAGTILEVKDHPDAHRLYCIQVDLGEPCARQVVAGLKEHFTPESLVGQQVVVVANLAPRTLRGEISQAMILTATDSSTLQFLTTSARVQNGSKIS